MAVAYLIYGYLGVGKTTVAKKLEKNKRAIRFTHDEWMARLYGADPDEQLFPEYFQRVSKLIDSVWPRCLELGINVVLDLNFWSKKHRDDTRKIITNLKCEYKLLNVQCPDTMAWSRIARRNNESDFKGLHISRNTYDILRNQFELLSAEETHENIDNTDNSDLF